MAAEYGLMPWDVDRLTGHELQSFFDDVQVRMKVDGQKNETWALLGAALKSLTKRRG